MKIKTVLLFWLLAVKGISAQSGFELPSGLRQVDIPFEYTNNFIIVTLLVNDALPLKFIFDTGAEHTILSKRQAGDLLKIHFEREFKITGSDLTTELTAYLARQIKFEIPGRTIAPKEDILVLKEDYFRFEEYAGVNVHGILAGNVFSKFIFKINYQRKIITLYDRKYFKAKELQGFLSFPIEILRNKIYINTKLQVLRDSVAPVKLLIDTGAGLALLLFTNTHPLLHPSANAIPSNIGMGLGGYLEGYTGRTYALELDSISQYNVISYFQSTDSSQNIDYLNSRNGLIGNSLLSRYQVMIDYADSKIWLKPSKDFRKAFVYDRSGLSFIASGPFLNEFLVQNVLLNSPAWNVDIRKGDELVKLGPFPVAMLSLDDIQKTLQRKAGKKIKIVLRRDGKRIKKHLILKDLL
ncbi:MAG: hypothetical protein WCR52_09760 [Bacteroidota bacterium]